MDKKYTVLLLYPDYFSSDLNPQTYLAHVVAADPQAAIDQAKTKCAQRGNGENGVDRQLAFDLYPLLVVEGHHNDMVGGN